MAREVSIIISAKDKISAGLGKAQAGLKKFGEAAKKIGGAAVTAFKKISKAALAVGAGIAAAVRESEKFAKSMAEVGTMSGGTEQELDRLKDGVIELSKQTGLATDTLAKGLYQTLSAGVPPENALTFLEAASKAAIAGVTDTETAVDALTTVINSWGMSTSEVNKVSDVLFNTVKNGKTTFSELSQYMGQASAITASAGVSFEEMSAVIATVTQQGVKTDQAFTGIKNAVTSILKPSEELAAKLDAVGMTGEQLLRERGLVGALQQVHEFSGGSTAEMAKLLPNVRALPIALGVTGTNAESAAKQIKLMAESGGAAADAFDRMDKVQAWPKLFASIKAAAIRFGDVFSELLGPNVERLTEKLNKMSEADWVDKTIRDIKVWAAEVRYNVDIVSNVFGSMAEFVDHNVRVMFQNLVNIAAEKLGKAKKVIENWAYNVGLEISAAIDPAVSRDDIQDLYVTWDHGFGQIEKATTSNLRSINDMYGTMGDMLIESETKKNKRITKANDDLNKSLKERAAEREAAAKREGELIVENMKVQVEAIEDLKDENDLLNSSIKDQRFAIQDAVESGEKLKKLFTTTFGVKKFVDQVQILSKGLSGLKGPENLDWLQKLSGISLSRLSAFQVGKFTDNIKNLAKGLAGVRGPMNLGFLKDLGNFELKKMTSSEIRRFVTNLTRLSTDLKDVKIPEIDLSMGLQNMNLQDMTKLAESLAKIKGGKVELRFEDKISAAIVQNEKNTRSIAETIKQAGGFG